jgi:ArsR family transcriptional regulator, arsenate/arsenite/antimonite-responsive transcriptional repressor / arsenate reductase (thioredoxin)
VRSQTTFADLVVTPNTVLEFLRALADERRLSILRLLALSDLRAGEICAALSLPANAISYHLKQLSVLGLIQDHRSSADGRDVYYRVDLERLDRLYTEAGEALHPGLVPSEQPSTDVRETPIVPLRVLFLCTHNSARSQMAEAILRHLGGDNALVFSAGSMPTEVHPSTLVVLRELGIETSQLYAKSLDQLLGESYDYIITVCDRVRDSCPVFRGDPFQIHWSFPDPVVVEDPSLQLVAFRRTAAELQTRVRYLLLLPHPRTGERLPPPKQ